MRRVYVNVSQSTIFSQSCKGRKSARITFHAHVWARIVFRLSLRVCIQLSPVALAVVVSAEVVSDL